jgi:hypothetical protein
MSHKTDGYGKDLLRDVTLDNGDKYVTRRPMFRELAKINLLLKPSDMAEEEAPAVGGIEQGPIGETKPAAATFSDQQRQLQMALEAENLMAATAITPAIVPDAQLAKSSKSEKRESEALPYAMDYYVKLLAAHFGKEEAALAPFRKGPGRGHGSAGPKVRGTPA